MINETIKKLYQDMINETNKIYKELEDIFNNYGYTIDDIDSSQKLILKSFYQTYGVEIYTPHETIVSDINLYQFMNEHEYDELEIYSRKRNIKIRLNRIQYLYIQMMLQNNINQNIKEYVNINKHLKDKTFTMDEWKDVLSNTNKITDKSHIIKDTRIISIIYNIVQPLFSKSKNQKGNNNITNKDAALIYDILYYIKYKSRDNTTSQKEKSDNIRYRLKKIVGNSNG